MAKANHCNLVKIRPKKKIMRKLVEAYKPFDKTREKKSKAEFQRRCNE